MSDIFISYARSTEAEAKQIAESLRALGYGVWRDDELPAHRAYAEVIEERLREAKAVVVVWSAEAVKSEWVQSEADRARADGKLVQLRLDGASLPMPFDRIQCADLAGWNGDTNAAGWRKVAASIAELTGAPSRTQASAPAAPRNLSICVLPFANMSGDAEQEYFSDGISEDIITDLSKVMARAEHLARRLQDHDPYRVVPRDLSKRIGEVRHHRSREDIGSIRIVQGQTRDRSVVAAKQEGSGHALYLPDKG